MEAYTSFAEIYDEMMDDIPYGEWIEYICELLKEQGITGGSIVELGCGTGKITRGLAGHGYDIIGVDNSIDMLTVAGNIEMQGEEVHAIMYILQDIRELQLTGYYDAIVSICDTMNYMADTDELKMVFSGVRRHLSTDGIFIFDMKTEHLYRDVIGNSMRTCMGETSVLIWDNEYDESARDNIYYLTMFIEADSDRNDALLYERFEEQHVQHVFNNEEVAASLRECGLEPVHVYGALTHEAPDKECERVYYVCRIAKD